MINKKTSNIRHIIPVLAGLIFLFFIVKTCQRFDQELFLLITTDPITSLSSREYKLSGSVSVVINDKEISTDGEIVKYRQEEIIQHGFCWSESRYPKTNENVGQLGVRDAEGSFTITISDLAANTKYFVRAYVNTKYGTEYGNEMSFTTPASLPTLTTVPPSEITETTAKSGGNITSDGGAIITARGVCWSLSQSPTTSDSKTNDGFGIGTFTSEITGLNCGTTYYVRAYATNSAGTAYGNEVSFPTSQCTANLPTVTTTSISNINETSAQGGGNITDDGGAIITARGVCWSTSQNPTISDSKTTDGSGTGSYTSDITGLNCGTTYYVRSYATNSAGTGYGSQVSFPTSQCTPNLPTVTTTSISNITANSAQSGGNVTSDGGASVTARGVCWSKIQNPTISDNKTNNGTGTGSYISSLTGLNCGTTYYVRAYATNSSGTAYGNEVNFPTSQCTCDIPTGLTVTNQTDFGAVLEWNIVEGALGYQLRIRKTTPTSWEYIYVSANYYDISFSCGFDLEYQVRNQCGTEYYSDWSDSFIFSVSDCRLPNLTTSEIENITTTTAYCGGTIIDNGLPVFDLRGVCWSTSPMPTVNDFTANAGVEGDNYMITINELSPNTIYYIRSFATNSEGNAYGNEKVFKTKTGNVTDYDENTYWTVTIGDQVWMAENLKVTHYSDGTNIPHVENASEWEALNYNDKAYCWYGNSIINKDIYGGLYTWAAAMNGANSSNLIPSGIQGVCPDGWHLPSHEEWKQLEIYLGMSEEQANDHGWRGYDEGGKLKESGFTHWNIPNTGATNSSGFTALPGGGRFIESGFIGIGWDGNWWTSTGSTYAAARRLNSSESKIYKADFIKSFGYSIRCVKD